MGIFNRSKDIPKEELNESTGNVQNYQIVDIEAYNFVRGLRLVSSDAYSNDYLLDNMMDDAIISAAVDMYLDDALQVDYQKKEIFWVEVDNTDDKYEEKLSQGLSKELNRFLKDDLRMNKELRNIAKRVIEYGSCVVRLDYIDKLEDDKLCLIDKNKKIFDSEEVKTKQSALVEAVDNLFNDKSNDLTESLSSLKDDNSTLYEDISFNDVKKKLNESLLKKSNKSILKESSDTFTKRLYSGRWSAEMIGQGSNIWELRAKGKTLAFLDVKKPNFILDSENLVSFSNQSGKYQVNFEVGPYDETDSKKDYYTLRKGESYLDNARIAWQVLSALEDILMLTRMTRSMLYRIFSVEVGSKGEKETVSILNSLKNRIKFDETVNVKEKIYNSQVRQIPLADSIFIPTRNGIGTIKIDSVGGDVNLKDAIDLDYFKDKLFAALRIPKAFLGFSDEGTGGMINTSLTRMDIRYARTIRGIQNILSEGLKDLCLTYLKLTRKESVLEELPDFKIVFTSINTEEDSQRSETQKTQMETLSKVIEAFGDLGVDITNYKDLRDSLIKDYLGSDYLEIIKNSEKENPELSTLPKNSKDSGDSDFGSSSDFSSDIPDFGGPNTSDNLDNISNDTNNNQEENNTTNTEESPLSDEDIDFQAPETKASPSGLTRELNTNA